MSEWPNWVGSISGILTIILSSLLLRKEIRENKINLVIQ